MTEADIPAVCALIPQLTGHAISPAVMRDRLDFAATSPIDWLYVAECGGQVRGVLGLRLRERLEHPSRYGEIYLIVIDAAARRQGIGRALMAFAEDWAHQHACCGMFLVSGLQRQDEAHRFYEQLGYAVTGYRFVKAFE